MNLSQYIMITCLPDTSDLKGYEDWILNEFLCIFKILFYHIILCKLQNILTNKFESTKSCILYYKGPGDCIRTVCWQPKQAGNRCKIFHLTRDYLGLGSEFWNGVRWGFFGTIAVLQTYPTPEIAYGTAICSRENLSYNSTCPIDDTIVTIRIAINHLS